MPSIRFDHPYAPKHDLERELRLPDLETFEFGPLPELDSFDESAISVETIPSDIEDIWEAAYEEGPARKDVLFHTWDAFEQRGHVEPPSAYLTECGPKVYDALLASNDGIAPAGKVLKGDILLQSLWNLGLGRTSILFQFNARLKSFEPTINDGRPSGVSLHTSKSLVTNFVHLGNSFLYLRSFCDRTFSSASSLSARVALATATSSILSTLEDRLGRQSAHITTLIQLQHHFTKPRDIVLHLLQMVDATRHAKNNEQLSSILHHRLLQVEEGDSHVRQLSYPILRQVAQPSLELFEQWIGTRKEDVSVPVVARESFVALAPDVAEDAPPEYTYRSEMMPRYLAPEDGNAIFETGDSVRFLKRQHPDHPIVNLDKHGIDPPSFDWSFKWQDIDAIATRAKKYEESLRQTLLAYGKGVKTEDKFVARTTQSEVDNDEQRPRDLENYFEQSIQQFSTLPIPHQALLDELVVSTTNVLDQNQEDMPSQNAFPPPLSLTSSLSFRPMISAHTKMVNAATLRLFFRSHHLRHHLSLQRQYHLLGDGVFSSLLATALFDPNRESAERHKGQMRSGVHMGLQLGSRSSWPPASSELRLALRGVLSESFYSSALYLSSHKDGAIATSTTSTGRDNDELPGQLNFAIRNLNEAEQEKVMDPDALPALDFLRLQYVPPVPLNLIITSTSLEKYDTIFRFLLRLLRILYVVSNLPRQYTDNASRQFRLEAHHFVTVLAKYVFETGIGSHWDTFDVFVSSIETRMNDEDEAGEYGTRVVEGISSIRDEHDQCLEGIMFSLFLRRRQRKIIALVDEIFEHILLFAKKQSRPNDADDKVSMGDLYSKLRGKIRVFLSVCRELMGKKGYGKDYGMGRGTAEENSIERLVVGMEGNGYFARG